MEARAPPRKTRASHFQGGRMSFSQWLELLATVLTVPGAFVAAASLLEAIKTRKAQGWGAKVIERLSKDLHAAFPEMKGFSVRNLKYMRAFAEAYPDVSFVQTLSAQMTWSHNIALLDKVKDREERLWYIQQAIKHG